MHINIRRCTTLLSIASLLTLAMFALTPGIAFANSNTNSQVKTYSSFTPLGGPYNNSDGSNSGYNPNAGIFYNPNDGIGYNPNDGIAYNSADGYQAPYGPFDNYGGYGGIGQPSPAYIASIDPNYVPQQSQQPQQPQQSQQSQKDTGHHYGGNGLPFSGYSNSGKSSIQSQ